MSGWRTSIWSEFANAWRVCASAWGQREMMGGGTERTTIAVLDDLAPSATGGTELGAVVEVGIDDARTLVEFEEEVDTDQMDTVMRVRP
jgi:hypothetical protein